jgi:hypothetical protein
VPNVAFSYIFLYRLKLASEAFMNIYLSWPDPCMNRLQRSTFAGVSYVAVQIELQPAIYEASFSTHLVRLELCQMWRILSFLIYHLNRSLEARHFSSTHFALAPNSSSSMRHLDYIQQRGHNATLAIALTRQRTVRSDCQSYLILF